MGLGGSPEMGGSVMRACGSMEGAAAKSARVLGMPRRRGEHVGAARFHHLPEVHHEDAVAHVLDHAQVVRDEHVGQRALGLQLVEARANVR